MYQLTQFGLITLPAYNTVWQQDPAPAERANFQTLGGAFDPWGTESAPQQFPHTISCEVTIYGADFANVRATLDSLRACIGKRDRLYRHSLDPSGAIDGWAWARVVRVPHNREIEQWESQPLTIDFDLWSPWYSGQQGVWTLDDGSYFDAGLFLDPVDTLDVLGASPATFTLNNGGNMPVDDIIVAVSAVGSAITAFDLRFGDTHLTYDGTVGAGTALVFDSALWAVTVGGVNAYSNFAFGTAHTLAGLIRIPVGSTAGTVTYTGGGTASTIEFLFYEVDA